MWTPTGTVCKLCTQSDICESLRFSTLLCSSTFRPSRPQHFKHIVRSTPPPYLVQTLFGAHALTSYTRSEPRSVCVWEVLHAFAGCERDTVRHWLCELASVCACCPNVYIETSVCCVSGSGLQHMLDHAYHTYWGHLQIPNLRNISKYADMIS